MVEIRYLCERRGYAGESDGSIDRGCIVRNGQAQLPDHGNLPFVTFLSVVERVLARNRFLSHHVISSTTVVEHEGVRVSPHRWRFALAPSVLASAKARKGGCQPCKELLLRSPRLSRFV